MENERKNPYDCSVCDNEDCSGCGESAWENGYSQALKDIRSTVEVMKNPWSPYEDMMMPYPHDTWESCRQAILEVIDE